MCGLAGTFSYADQAPPVDQTELIRMREHMIKRGPDGTGLYISPDQRLGLAFRRLAIIDLSSNADQPMASQCGRYQVVFNGEIYNYRELRQELQSQGAIFRTQSDTEVLLASYIRYGLAMCSHLRGMFAFAIWDEQEKSLFLARDPFGIKPLYIHDDGKSIRFASQVKALLAGGGIEKTINADAEYEYWIWGHVPEPLTLYQGVNAFEPGTWQLVQRGGKSEAGTFDTIERMLKGESERRTEYPSLRDALLDSVQHHLVSDVPVGLFLSAGIDSATLCGLASEVTPRLKTITLGFEEYKGTGSDETQLAQQVAKLYGTEHKTVWISRSDFEGAYEQFMQDMDQPTIDGLNTWLVAREASKLGLKVAISGMGGDEFFGGYPSFKQLPKIRRITKPFERIPGLGKMVRKVAAPLIKPFANQKYAGILEYGATWQGAYMLRRAMRMPWEVGDRTMNYTVNSCPEFRVQQATVSYLEATQYMRNQLLRDSDWASMSHSLELRLPLVDRELVTYIGQEQKRGRIRSKQDLASAAKPALPSDISSRAKTGFTVPVIDWMQKNVAAAPLANDQTANTWGLRGWQTSVLSGQRG